MKRAIAYIRVSSSEQVGNFSLSSQGRLCSEFCERNGWELIAIFIEWGESAQSADRSTLQEMLRYCRQRKRTIDYVVVYRVDRFARFAKDHSMLEGMLNSYGAQLRSVTEPVDETDTGRLLGTILSGISEFDNRIRIANVKRGMREAVDQGHWPFGAPTIGYISARDEKKKSIVVVDHERAPLIRRAFEQFATGLYTDLQIRKELTALGLRTRKGSMISRQQLSAILRNPFYTGWLIVGPWGERKRGNFPALVDQETFDKVQAVLAGKLPKTTPEPLGRPEFPLRRFAKCGKCGARLTAAWCTGGKNRRYPYYTCAKHCRGINIRKEELERKFLEILDRVRMKPEVIALFQKLVCEVWRSKQEGIQQVAAVSRRRLTEFERQRQCLFDAFVYKNAIKEEHYRQESHRLEAEIANARIETTVAEEELDVKTLIEFAGELILNAADYWLKLPLDQKQRLQKVLLPQAIVLNADKTVRTDATCSSFNLLQIDSGENAMTAWDSCDSWNSLLAWLRQIEGFRQSLTSLLDAA